MRCDEGTCCSRPGSSEFLSKHCVEAHASPECQELPFPPGTGHPLAPAALNRELPLPTFRIIFPPDLHRG